MHVLPTSTSRVANFWFSRLLTWMRIKQRNHMDTLSDQLAQTDSKESNFTGGCKAIKKNIYTAFLQMHALQCKLMGRRIFEPVCITCCHHRVWLLCQISFKAWRVSKAPGFNSAGVFATTTILGALLMDWLTNRSPDSSFEGHGFFKYTCCLQSIYSVRCQDQLYNNRRDGYLIFCNTGSTGGQS